MEMIEDAVEVRLVDQFSGERGAFRGVVLLELGVETIGEPLAESPIDPDAEPPPVALVIVLVSVHADHVH
jgi:hypothetical protein